MVNKGRHPVDLYSPVQWSYRSTLHCFTSIAPRSTASLPSLHAPPLHCCRCLPRSYVQAQKEMGNWRGSPDSCAASPVARGWQAAAPCRPLLPCAAELSLHPPLLHCRLSTALLLSLHCVATITAPIAPTYSTKGEGELTALKRTTHRSAT